MSGSSLTVARLYAPITGRWRLERQRGWPSLSALPDASMRRGRRLESVLLGVGVSTMLLAGPALADSDCLKRCVKECNKIAPGSPEYCQETCADECSFQAAEGAEAEAEGKSKVAGMGFLADDYDGSSLDSTLGGLFNWNRVGPNTPRR